MLSVLAASVAVLAVDQRRQPLLGDDTHLDLEEALPFAPNQPLSSASPRASRDSAAPSSSSPPSSASVRYMQAVNRAHREIVQLQQAEVKKAGLPGKAK